MCLAKLFSQDAGSVAIVFAAAAPLVIGGAAMATDAAMLVNQRTALQAVADSAALGGAKELQLYDAKESVLKSAVTERVKALLKEQGFADANPPVDVQIDQKAQSVSVTVEVSPQTFVLHQLGYGETLSANAVAGVFGSARLCVLTLNSSASEALRVDRIGAVTAPECAVQANSTHTKAIGVHLLSKLVGKAICSGGGVSGAGAAFTPEPMTDCPAVEDPLATREPPAVGGCDYTNKKLILGIHKISPGHYCGGLKLLPGALVKAEPGDYVFSGGNLEAGLAASLTGEDVSFRFLDTSTFKFGLGSIVKLSAPREGPMGGFLFYQDRSASAGAFTVATDLATKLLGTIYLPKGVFKVDVIGIVAGDSAYTVIVADKLDVRGAKLMVNSDYGATDVPVPAGVGPTSGSVALAK